MIRSQGLGRQSGLSVLLAVTGYPPGFSGAGTRLHAQYCRLQNLLSPAALRWSVMTKREIGEAGDAPKGPERIRYAPTVRNLSRMSTLASAIPEMRWVAREIADGLLNNVDVVHLAGWSWFSLALARAARRASIPVLREFTSQGDTGSASRVGGYFIRRTNRAADRFVAISPPLKDRAVAACGLDPERILVRPNPVDVSRFCFPGITERAAARASLASYFQGDLPADAVLVGMIGRLRPLKGQQLLINAFDYLPARFRGVIVGPPYSADDAYYRGLMAAVREPHRSGRVAVIDRYVARPEAIYAGLDVLAFASVGDGLGNVMLEALCCGVPVAAVANPGITDWVVTDGVSGAICSAEPACLARAIERTTSLPVSQTLADTAAACFGSEAIDRALFDALEVCAAQLR